MPKLMLWWQPHDQCQRDDMRTLVEALAPNLRSMVAAGMNRFHAGDNLSVDDLGLRVREGSSLDEGYPPLELVVEMSTTPGHPSLARPGDLLQEVLRPLLAWLAESVLARYAAITHLDLEFKINGLLHGCTVRLEDGEILAHWSPGADMKLTGRRVSV